MVKVAGCVIGGEGIDLNSVFVMVKEELAEHGIKFESSCFSSVSTEEGKPDAQKTKDSTSNKDTSQAKVKVVCVAPNLGQSIDEMSNAPRDQVVMVRVDQDTASRLDAWVETGAVKSRSEAAAVFIREGLKVRDSELEGLRDAINKVQEAKTRLHREAREVFGMEPDQTSDNPDPSETGEDS